MTVTPASLRVLCPEFSDATVYPDASISAWVAQAALQLDPARWGALLDFGTTLYVCHRIALAARNKRVASAGGLPGQASGAVQSKSVDKVSQSFDTASASEEGAGMWNLTTYGQEFIRLARQVGAGPMTVNTDDSATSGVDAYAGPGWVVPFAY